MLLAGTADGIYTVADGPARAVGRFGQSIRRIIRYGTEIPATGDGNLSCSRDGGRAWDTG